MTRFASITADLLARKGEASPWPGAGNDMMKTPLAWERPASPPYVEACTQDEKRPRQRKVSVRMRQHDYERLGILAVKEGKTRQRLLQEAVDRLFTGMSEEFGPDCRCLGSTR
jgi:hypothetical protein